MSVELVVGKSDADQVANSLLYTYTVSTSEPGQRVDPEDPKAGELEVTELAGDTGQPTLLVWTADSD